MFNTFVFVSAILTYVRVPNTKLNELDLKLIQNDPKKLWLHKLCVRIVMNK